MVPGEYIFDGPDLELNAGRPVVTLSVNNTGDRPVQVGSHYHFFETNKALVFDREKAYGMRLDLPSGTSVRFEPGDVKEVKLVPYGGRRVVYGFNGLVIGPPGRPLHARDEPEALHRAGVRPQAVRATKNRRRRSSTTRIPNPRTHRRHRPMSVKLSRKAYAKKYGPTVGDRIRLADTELIIEIEHDYTDYGEESIFGGGKSIRDGQDQCPLEEPMSPTHCDLVITNAVIIDHWGIVKGDIGIREGRIVAVGKSGNPLTQ